MKVMFACFGVAFVLMSITGSIRGYQSVHRPEVITSLAIHAITPESDGKSDYFVYRNAGIPKYRWHVQTRTFEVMRPVDLQAFATQTPPFVFPVTETHLLTFAGGGAATWKLKDLLSKVKGGERTKGKIIASVLGGVSGYLLGYKLGTSMLPDGDSPEVASLLSKPSFWREHEKEMYLAMCYRLLLAARSLQDQAVRDQVEYFVRALASSALDARKDLDLTHVRDLRELNQKFARANVGATTTSTTPWWLSWWFILLTLASGLGGCAAVGVFIDRRAQARVPSRIIMP